MARGVADTPDRPIVSGRLPCLPYTPVDRIVGVEVVIRTQADGRSIPFDCVVSRRMAYFTGNRRTAFAPSEHCHE